MGSALGVARSAARKIGWALDDYLARRARGERWCTTCQQWKHRRDMTADRTRAGGIGSRCRPCSTTRRHS